MFCKIASLTTKSKKPALVEQKRKGTPHTLLAPSPEPKHVHTPKLTRM